MKPANAIRTHRPEQGLVAFVRAAAGLASVRRGMHIGTPGFFGSASLCWLERAEDQVHPGEGSA